MQGMRSGKEKGKGGLGSGWIRDRELLLRDYAVGVLTRWEGGTKTKEPTDLWWCGLLDTLLTLACLGLLFLYPISSCRESDIEMGLAGGQNPAANNARGNGISRYTGSGRRCVCV